MTCESAVVFSESAEQTAEPPGNPAQLAAFRAWVMERARWKLIRVFGGWNPKTKSDGQAAGLERFLFSSKDRRFASALFMDQPKICSWVKSGGVSSLSLAPSSIGPRAPAAGKGQGVRREREREVGFGACACSMNSLCILPS